MTNEAHGVRRARERAGLSQVELAEHVGLTRQSIGAIEAGRASPSVDVALRLAKVLHTTVEQLFGIEPDAARVVAEPCEDVGEGSRVALTHIDGRWVAHGLERTAFRTTADAVAYDCVSRRLRVELVAEEAAAEQNVVLLGCAPALGLLCDRATRTASSDRYLWVPASSTGALRALARRQAQVAGVHLVDARSGEPNVSDVLRLVPGRAVVLITFARWEMGLAVVRGRQRRVRSSDDLARRGLRVAVREPGAGARRLLASLLARAGVSERSVLEHAVPVRGHLETADAVRFGVADTGITSRDAALAAGLDFLPLAEERYDLAMPADFLGDARSARLVDCLTSRGFRRELEGLGYDASPSGERVAEVPAS